MVWLIGCEFSQEVCTALRHLGEEAYSCDIDECTGGHPEWHLQMDIFKAIDILKPDALIGFPPCTDLAVSGTRSFAEKIADGRQQKSIEFFLRSARQDIQYIAVENPIGIMSTNYRKPDQIIQPFWFGDPYKKSTCLWLKGLPKLIPTNMVEPEFLIYKSSKTKSGFSKYSKFGKLGKGCGKQRSVTPKGFAEAMANQWSKYLKEIIY